MSFRWFIYYCALLGGCAAYLGWAVGRLLLMQHAVWLAACKGLFFGLLVAAGLAIVDLVGNFAGQKGSTITLRTLVAGLVGAGGGFLGGMLGQILYGRTDWALFLLFGWTITGLLIGIGPGLFDLFVGLASNKDASGAIRKVVHGLLGGTLGGISGGLLFLLLRVFWRAVLGKRIDEYWSPSATEFVGVGLCIGLWVSLAQVILKEAWIKVVEGVRSGREWILNRSQVTIGRAGGCDIPLVGDKSIEKQHARICREGGRYYLEDLQTHSGTYLNGQRIHDRAALRGGDEIQVGQTVLQFGERHKRARDG